MNQSPETTETTHLELPKAIKDHVQDKLEGFIRGYDQVQFLNQEEPKKSEGIQMHVNYFYKFTAQFIEQAIEQHPKTKNLILYHLVMAFHTLEDPSDLLSYKEFGEQFPSLKLCKFIESPEQMMQVIKSSEQYLKWEVENKNGVPSDEIITAVLDAHEEEQIMSETVDNCILSKYPVTEYATETAMAVYGRLVWHYWRDAGSHLGNAYIKAYLAKQKYDNAAKGYSYQRGLPDSGERIVPAECLPSVVQNASQKSFTIEQIKELVSGEVDAALMLLCDDVRSELPH